MKFARLLIIILIIGALVSAFTILFYWATGTKFTNNDLVGTFIYITIYGTVLTSFNWAFAAFIHRYFSWTDHTNKRLILAIFGHLIVTLIGLFLVALLIAVVVEGDPVRDFIEHQSLRDYRAGIIITIIVTLGFYLYDFWKHLAMAMKREVELVRENEKAKFNALKAQLDPHFLFNSLNVLDGLIDEDPEKAKKFVRDLSVVYRYVLDKSKEDVVSLREELNFAQNYLELFQNRFEEGLQYRIDIPEPVKDLKCVLPLSLQLLLENAIKHNVINKRNPLNIEVFERNGHLHIRNSRKAKNQIDKSSKLGLKNIEERYALITDQPIRVLAKEESFEVIVPLIEIDS